MCHDNCRPVLCGLLHHVATLYSGGVPPRLANMIYTWGRNNSTRVVLNPAAIRVCNLFAPIYNPKNSAITE